MPRGYPVHQHPEMYKDGKKSRSKKRFRKIPAELPIHSLAFSENVGKTPVTLDVKVGQCQITISISSLLSS